MGSLNHPDLPVVSKTSDTFKKLDKNILRTVSTNDSKATLVSNTEGPRVISSGSIVRDDGTVEYFEDLVWGLYNESRSTSGRVASNILNGRDLSVPITGSGTLAVIEETLQPHTPQIGSVKQGDRIVLRNSVDDTLTEDRIDPNA